VNTGAGKLVLGYLCLLILIHGVASAQVLMSDASGKQPGNLSMAGEGSPYPSAITGTSGGVLPPSRSEIIGEFMILALNLKNPASMHTVTKWTIPSVDVKVSGDPDEESRQCLAESIADINNLTGSVHLQIIEGGSPEIEMDFIPLEEFPRQIPGYVPNLEGYTRCEVVKGSLQECTVWLPTTGVDEELRCTILRHEMARGIGLMGLSDHPESILSQGSVADGYSTLDRDVIRLLYNPALRPGSTEETVEAYLAA